MYFPAAAGDRTPPRRLYRSAEVQKLPPASRSYSRSLTQAQREACIAAGAKVRSRKRLGQCGPLTGQQYWVKGELVRAKSMLRAKRAVFAAKEPKPQMVARSTSGVHQSITGHSPGLHRRTTLGARRTLPGLQNRFRLPCRSPPPRSRASL